MSDVSRVVYSDESILEYLVTIMTVMVLVKEVEEIVPKVQFSITGLYLTSL